jgi:hypothetical protein
MHGVGLAALILLKLRGARQNVNARCRNALEHDPEKWKPVFRKDHAQTKS